MDIDDLIDTSSAGITAFVLISIIVFVYIPLSVYHGYKYYKQRNHIIMKKRYSSIMIIEIVVIIMKLMIDATRDALKLYTSSSNRFHITISILAGLLYKIMVCIWVWRFWCLHYDLNWTDVMFRQEWKSIINSTINTENFYLSNKSTFGNKQWIFKRFILPLIIFTFLTTDIVQFVLLHVFYIDEKHANTVKLCSIPISIGPVIFLTIIYFKIPKFKDHFFIKNELGLLLISILMMYLSYWSYYLFIQFGEDILTAYSYHKIIKYFHPASTFAVVFFDFLCLMISTFLVNNKVKKIINTESYSVHRFDNKDFSSNDKSKRKRSSVDVPLIKIKLLPDNIAEYDEYESESRQSNYQFSLHWILNNNTGVDMFMEHLQYEISTENLLCFVELVQFQKYVVTNSNCDCNTERILIYETINFADSIPNSLIVFDGKDMFSEKARRLYKKYIRVNGEYQINMPYRGRKKFAEWIETNDNENVEELVMLVDNILVETLDLLNQSFYRFQQSASYKTLCRQILAH